MLALLAAILFTIGFFVSKIYEHPDVSWFWILLGLIALALHEAFGGVIATRRGSKW